MGAWRGEAFCAPEFTVQHDLGLLYGMQAQVSLTLLGALLQVLFFFCVYNYLSQSIFGLSLLELPVSIMSFFPWVLVCGYKSVLIS